MTNDDEHERAAKRKKRNDAVFTNAAQWKNEHLEALEVIDEVNAHLTSRWPKSHDGLSSTNCLELLRSIERLEEAEKQVSAIEERIDLTWSPKLKTPKAPFSEKKKKKAQPSAMTATTTKTKGAKCMAILSKNGEPCVFQAKDGFLTCGYQSHRAQEEELRKKTVPRVDSTASTATNAQAPPPTQPSVAQLTRKGSRLKPPDVVAKKRKRGDDEEELEHTDHSPDEVVPDCPACAAGCSELTQPSSEEADQRDYRFDSPEPPEDRIPHGLPPSPTLDGPILPSPTSMDADRLEAEQTGFRNPWRNELMEELRLAEEEAKRKAEEEAEAKRKAEEEAEAKRKTEEENVRAFLDSWPLHYAVWCDQVDVVRELIEAEADVDRDDDEGATPLHYAARYGHVDIVRALIEAGADPTKTLKCPGAQYHGFTARDLADFQGHEGVVRVLDEEADKKAATEAKYRGPDGLINAIEDEKMGIANVLICNSNVDVNYTKQSSGWTALHTIISTDGKYDVTDMLEAILEKNPNVNAQDVGGFTPLHRAVTQTDVVAIKLLIERGADKSIKNKNGMTPFEFAMHNNGGETDDWIELLRNTEEDGTDDEGRPRRECKRTRDPPSKAAEHAAHTLAAHTLAELKNNHGKLTCNEKTR